MPHHYFQHPQNPTPLPPEEGAIDAKKILADAQMGDEGDGSMSVAQVLEMFAGLVGTPNPLGAFLSGESGLADPQANLMSTVLGLDFAGINPGILESLFLSDGAGASGGGGGVGPRGPSEDLNELLNFLITQGVEPEEALGIILQSQFGFDAEGSAREDRALGIRESEAAGTRETQMAQIMDMIQGRTGQEAETGFRRAFDTSSLEQSGLLGRGGLQAQAGGGIGNLASLLGQLGTAESSETRQLTELLTQALLQQEQLGLEIAGNPRNAVPAFLLGQGAEGNLPEFDVSRILGLNPDSLGGLFDQAAASAQGIISPEVLELINAARTQLESAGATPLPDYAALRQRGRQADRQAQATGTPVAAALQTGEKEAAEAAYLQAAAAQAAAGVPSAAQTAQHRMRQ